MSPTRPSHAPLAVPAPRRRAPALARLALGAAVLCALVAALPAAAVQRFPKPEFESGYVQPEPTAPAARSAWLEYLDCAVLAGALALASWLVLRRRSRREIALLMLFCLLYFGFWRAGCVCPVGAVQNAALALADRDYAIPLPVLLFFLLPLLTALVAGRTFCGAVCPLGALQDVVIVRPVRVPAWLQAVLGFVPYLVLAATAVLAAGGAGFLVCQHDPFVAFFRFGGPALALVFGFGILLLGAFVARPYCRFLCPYGALLHGASLLAWRHATITPDECIECRLCEDSCPFGAIRVPNADLPAPESRRAGRRRLAWLLALLPVCVLVGALAGRGAGGLLAQRQADVNLAEQVLAADAGEGGVPSLEATTFRASGEAVSDLVHDARQVRGRIRSWSQLAGAGLGLLLGGQLIARALRRHRRDYVPDRGTCLSCGRCFRYCPRERLRLRRDRPGDAAAGEREAGATACRTGPAV